MYDIIFVSGSFLNVKDFLPHLIAELDHYCETYQYDRHRNNFDTTKKALTI